MLIIGNGFDLDVGLPTSYSDFLASSNFQLLLESNNRLTRHLSSTQERNNWVDIEQELVRYSNLSHGRKNPIEFRNDYLALCDALENYIRQIDYANLDKSSRAAALLARLAKTNKLCVVNFNYTRTAEYLLQAEPSAVSHIQVHGSAKNKDTVFGVHDSAGIQPNHVFLRKAVSKGFFVDCLVGEIMKNAKESVSIFGHSLGETDHTQFLPFFGPGQNKKLSNIDIYYNSENGYYNLYQQLDKLTSQRLQTLRTKHNFRMLGPTGNGQ